MVMESISPQCVGKEFVRQYYTVLNKAPLHLHRFYSDDSSFVHGGLDQSDEDPVVGQQNIHQKIMQLNFRDCHAKIRQVDAHSTLKNGVVVQVIGELSNNGEPMRQFMQTFVLAPQTPKKYYVRNDIFRYHDEGFIEDEDYENTPDTNIPPVLKLQALHLNVQADKDMDDQISTTAPDSRDNNNYYEKDYIRNGTSHLNENEHLSLNSLNVASNNNNNNSLNSNNAVSLAPSQTLSSLGSTVVDLSASSQPHVDIVSSTHSLPPQREGDESPCKSEWEDSPEEEEEEEEDEEEEDDEEPVTESSVTADQQLQNMIKSDIHISEMDDIGTQSLLTPEPKTYANMVSKNTPPSGIPGSHLPGPPLGTPFTNLVSQQPSTQQPLQPQQQPIQHQQTQQQQQVSPNSTMMFGGSKQGTDFPKLDHHVHQQQQQQQQQSISPNNFSGPGGGNYRGMGPRPMRYNHRNVNGRMHNADTSSSSGNTSGGTSFTSSNRYNDDSGSEGVMEKRKPINYYQDSQQVFVGNLPHEIGFEDLKEIFQKFGPVVDMRINSKQNQKMGPSGKSPVPNYGFVVFEDEETVQKVLQNKPILYGQHRLNVEEKKAKPRDMGDRMMPSAGRGGMMMRHHMGGGMSRGGGARGGMRGTDRGRGGPNYSNNRR